MWYNKFMDFLIYEDYWGNKNKNCSVGERSSYFGAYKEMSIF